MFRQNHTSQFSTLLPQYTESYRYGFGSHEKNDEVKGSGNWYTLGDFGYDPRTGKRWRPDPLESQYPWISPYAAFANNPLYYVDVDGRKIKPANKETRKMLKELYKNGTEEVRAKLDVLKKSDVIYNVNFYATQEQINANTTALETNQTPLGVTNYDFATSEKKGKDVVNVLVADGDLQGYDRRLVAVNEVGGAYDFEVGNVGYAQQGNKSSVFAYDVVDEYDQAMDVIGYAEKNNIAFPEKSGYKGLKNIRDNTYMPTRGEKLDAARLVFNNSLGYDFPDTQSQNTASEVEKVKNSSGAKGTDYVYRKDGKRKN
jgi:hypothetical protein